jgi:glycosyltransferase involved in cell wall biosynthesis
MAKHERPDILMLGWEFPPIINGGLGVACHDLSAAMSDLANITMIIPKSSPGFKMNNLNLVGINNIDPRTFREMLATPREPLPFELHEVMADLNPYYREPLVAEGEGMGGEVMRTIVSDDPGSFNIDNLYGTDVINKVIQYSKIASSLAENMSFDIIHAHDWMTMLAGIRIRQQTGKPLVMHIHSLEVDRGGTDSRGWVYELEKKGMEYADLVIPVSRFTADNIEKYYGISRNKIRVVYNGSRLVKAFRSKRQYPEKTVLFVGRLTRQKGPEIFLDIAKRVLEKNLDVRFVMAGVGDYFNPLLEKSSYQSLGNRFHMTGFLNVEKLNYLFSVSDVYCMPSVSEPFGLSAVEAAHFRIPCVLSRQSGVSEVLHGALKFDHWDVHKAADSILSLLRDKVLRKKVVRDACKDLREITWENSAKGVMEAYRAFNFI